MKLKQLFKFFLPKSVKSYWVVRTYSRGRYYRGYKYLTNDDDWDPDITKAKRYYDIPDRHRNRYEDWIEIKI